MSLPFAILGAGREIGRLFGIRITVNGTFLPMAALLTLMFALSMPLPFVAALPLGAAFTFLVYGSVLLHELGHALTARVYGIRTRAITLHLLGGVAAIEGEPRRPSEEILIAAAGPAVSFLLAMALGVPPLVAIFLGASPALVAILAWPATVNLGLAIFNLLPGLPLDGGRILRGVLWAWRGDRISATLAAARAGEFLGWGLIGLGALSILGIVAFGGLWTVLIGWFVLSAARHEKRSALMQRLGAPMSLEELFGRLSRSMFQSRPLDRRDAEEEDEVVRFPDGREVWVRRRR